MLTQFLLTVLYNNWATIDARRLFLGFLWLRKCNDWDTKGFLWILLALKKSNNWHKGCSLSIGFKRAAIETRRLCRAYFMSLKRATNVTPSLFFAFGFEKSNNQDTKAVSCLLEALKRATIETRRLFLAYLRLWRDQKSEHEVCSFHMIFPCLRLWKE